MKGAIFEQWGRNGWEAGHLGYPTSNEFCGLRGGGCGQHFQNGSIYWSPAYGVHFVKGAIRDKWGAMGWEQEFGYPKTDEICGMRNGGCRQQFEGDDMIYWSGPTGAHAVYQEFMAKWGEYGWETGRLGYPVDDLYGFVQNGVSEYGIEFQGGWLYFFYPDTQRVYVNFK